MVWAGVCASVVALNELQRALLERLAASEDPAAWDPGDVAQLATTLRAWRQELATGRAGGKARDPRGNIAACVADREAVNHVMYYLATEAELTVAELTKEGVTGDGDTHVGTMHRFKGLEY